MHACSNTVNRSCPGGILLAIILLLLLPCIGLGAPPPLPPAAATLLDAARPRLNQELANKNLQLGVPVFIRIFKLEGTLEVWMRRDNYFVLFKTYPICSYSGFPGPKIREGDWQSPEGFYTVSAKQMHPGSRYHLAFNIGYPNEFDRYRKRTGSAIMVHGGCSSRGCFAMGDRNMEEIYLLAHSALAEGQKQFDVHIFPFKLSQKNMHKFRSSPWFGFWKTLQPGYMAFCATHQVPQISTINGRYVINAPGARVALIPAHHASVLP